MHIIRQAITAPKVVDLSFFINAPLANNSSFLQISTRNNSVIRPSISLTFIFLVSVIFIIITSTFALFVPLGLGLYYEINMAKSLSITLTVLTALLSYHTLFFYFKLLRKDPGIIIPNNDLELVSYMQNNKLRFLKLPLNLNPMPINIANNRTQLKFCSTCRLYRPIKTSHCSYCNFCISEFDHHCVYLDICIGQKNYSTFLKFITYSLLTVIINSCFGACLIYYFIKASPVWSKHNIIFIIMLSVSELIDVIFMILDLIFVMFHWKFIYRNVTTKEYNNRIVYLNPIDDINYGCMRILKAYLKDEIPSMIDYMIFHKILNVNDIIDDVIKKDQAFKIPKVVEIKKNESPNFAKNDIKSESQLKVHKDKKKNRNKNKNQIKINEVKIEVPLNLGNNNYSKLNNNFEHLSIDTFKDNTSNEDLNVLV